MPTGSANTRNKLTADSIHEDDLNLETISSKLSKDGKLIVSAILLHFSKVELKFFAALKEKDDQLSKLNAEVVSLKKKVSQIEENIDKANSYERRDTLIVSGPSIPEFTQGEKTAEIFRDLVRRKLKMNIDQSDINVAHRLGKKGPSQMPDKRKIIVKMCRREKKSDVIIACKKANLSETGLFMNESLSPVRRKIFYILRKIKREHRDVVSGCSTVNGRVFVFTKSSSNQRDTRHFINSHEKLVEFCREYVKKPLEFFLENAEFSG